MKLNFVISEQPLFIAGLLQEPEIDGWVDLQNRFWDKYRLGYKLLQSDYYDIFESDNVAISLERAKNEVILLLEEGIRTLEFSKLLENAQKNKTWLEQEWSKNKENIENELTDIIRTDLPNEPFTIYVMGNLVYVGQHLGNNKIAFGHKENWKNYSMVYLAHECLHEMFSNSKLEHAVIELITDNELRIRLNKGGEYFTCDGKDVGHGYLKDLEKKLLPNWKNYLANKTLNIHDFVRLNEDTFKN